MNNDASSSSPSGTGPWWHKIAICLEDEVNIFRQKLNFSQMQNYELEKIEDIRHFAED